MKTVSLPARGVRIKIFREYLRDYGMMDDVPKDGWNSTFVYANDGINVPDDDLVVPWESDVPARKFRKLEDILGTYAKPKNWDYMEIGDEL